MKKIIHINIGGYPFSIDDTAYVTLNDYLEVIENHFSQAPGMEEIMTDIESRVAELFNEELKSKKIITDREVDAVIKIMGTPEDFGARQSTNGRTKIYGHGDKTIEVGKKLFRDPENKVLGGVCSGLSAYFGIDDPIWIRLGMVLITIFAGIPLFIYFLLWAIVPEAKTAADRLAMQGKRANVKNISSIVQQELNVMGERINELGKELKSKKKV